MRYFRWTMVLDALAVPPGDGLPRDGARTVPEDDALSVTLPHPGYLNDCVPSTALRPGEQRLIDFECEGLLNETQFWWKENDALADVDIRLADEETLTIGLCGAIFKIRFSTPIAVGEITSTPGRDCGRFRHYACRIQRRSRVR
jgi:hypothetical protein